MKATPRLYRTSRGVYGFARTYKVLDHKLSTEVTVTGPGKGGPWVATIKLRVDGVEQAPVCFERTKLNDAKADALRRSLDVVLAAVRELSPSSDADDWRDLNRYRDGLPNGVRRAG